MRVQPDDLRSLTAPTLVIWGDHDPTGTVEAAQRATSLIPNARLEMLPAGHVPWLGTQSAWRSSCPGSSASDGEG